LPFIVETRGGDTDPGTRASSSVTASRYIGEGMPRSMNVYSEQLKIGQFYGSDFSENTPI